MIGDNQNQRLIISNRILTGLIVLLIVILIALLIRFPRERDPDIRWDTCTKSNIHSLQIALQRFADEHNGVYPYDFNSLFYEGYMYSTPQKPWSDEPMRNIPFGTVPYSWEFTYIPVFDGCDVTGYYLLGYGSDRGESYGYDIDGDGKKDGVIIVVNDNDFIDWNKAGPDPVLTDLLNLKSNPIDALDQADTTESAAPENE